MLTMGALACGIVYQFPQAEAALKSKFATYETKQRDQLAEMQPVVQEWIREGLESEPRVQGLPNAKRWQQGNGYMDGVQSSSRQMWTAKILFDGYTS